MRAPTLAEVLTNQAPPPYTLSAFMAFLSQNHCLETLEFTLDASRYQTYYYSLAQRPPIPGSDEANRLRSSWDRLIASYIKPGAMREVNLAASDRDFLMRIPNTYTPPSPEALDSAVFKITELMRDSVLSPFLQSCQQKLAQDAGPAFSDDGRRPFLEPHYSHQPAPQWGAPKPRDLNNTPDMHFPRARTYPFTRNVQNLESQMADDGRQAQHAQSQRSHVPISQPNASGLSQLFGGNGRKIVRPTSAPTAEFMGPSDSWPNDSDMSGSEDPITPPHTPPGGNSPGGSGGQWKSKFKSHFKISSGRTR